MNLSVELSHYADTVTWTVSLEMYMLWLREQANDPPCPPPGPATCAIAAKAVVEKRTGMLSFPTATIRVRNR